MKKGGLEGWEKRKKINDGSRGEKLRLKKKKRCENEIRKN